MQHKCWGALQARQWGPSLLRAIAHAVGTEQDKNEIHQHGPTPWLESTIGPPGVDRSEGIRLFLIFFEILNFGRVETVDMTILERPIFRPKMTFAILDDVSVKLNWKYSILLENNPF